MSSVSIVVPVAGGSSTERAFGAIDDGAPIRLVRLNEITGMEEDPLGYEVSEAEGAAARDVCGAGVSRVCANYRRTDSPQWITGYDAAGRRLVCCCMECYQAAKAREPEWREVAQQLAMEESKSWPTLR